MTYIKYAAWVLLAVVAIGAYFFPQIPVSFGASTAGTTMNTEKFAGIVANLSAPGANATSSSILNTDANDRYITAVKAGCEGLGTSQTAYTGTGLVALRITVSTTSTAAPASAGTLIAGGGVLTIATATPQFIIASSTSASSSAGSGLLNNIWTAGSYLTFQSNATNTAICTLGVDYMQS